MTKQVDDYKDEDDTPLSLLAQQLRVDQSILQNVHIELPTEENTGDWERTFHVYMIYKWQSYYPCVHWIFS